MTSIRSTQPRLTIVVCGTIASVPGHGGWTWAVLQYVLGLRRLGHRVLLLDPIQPAAVRPPGSALAPSTNADYFRSVVARFGLEGAAAALRTGPEPQAIGLSRDEILGWIEASDLLLNLSGVLADEALLGAARRRVYVDLDPAFTQLWHAVQGIDMGFAAHTDFVTIGRAIGTPGCTVPTCGLPWIHTWQPVVLEHWPPANGSRLNALTTVANWRGYGSIHHDGVFYGQKAHSWRELMTLPTLTPERFLVALGIHPDEAADVEALAAGGWERVDPAEVAATPDDYQRFVRRSKGEFAVAKSGYVASQCGWFSDRSVCYLASGRPVLAQETGFSRALPSGEGVVAFDTTDQALAAVEDLNVRYAAHARAARAIAERFFDSDAVLGELLERLAPTASCVRRAEE